MITQMIIIVSAKDPVIVRSDLSLRGPGSTRCDSSPVHLPQPWWTYGIKPHNGGKWWGVEKAKEEEAAAAAAAAEEE
ncbi:hypothetical protein PV325_005702 [Microctonus aethiopoides]|nr:hypothetical protein PV325_005702 [Microctonus aethiopoides]